MTQRSEQQWPRSTVPGEPRRPLQEYVARVHQTLAGPTSHGAAAATAWRPRGTATRDGGGRVGMGRDAVHDCGRDRRRQC